MIINRHNYEEFFLLYVDNELAQEDRAAVENFVLQNPDMADEMEMLKQAVLPVDKIEFEQKELLYNEGQGITLNNFEEYFVLSVDDELSQKEKEEVEKFVLKHPELQNEYLLLQQTRLEPDAIVFAEKEKLYRKAGKEKPVIFTTWMRMSAAAAIIGLVAFTWLFTQSDTNSSGNNPPVVSVPQPQKTLEGAVKEPVKPGATKETMAAVPKAAVKNAIQTKNREPKVPERVKVNNDVAEANTPKNKNNLPIEDVARRMNSQEAATQKVNADDEAVASVKTNKSNSPVHEQDELKTTFTNKSNDDGSAIVKNAVYKEIDNREDEEERTFYLGSAQINKNKLKGLFKKATSFFDKKDNKNPEERTLRIAGFEIKSK